MIVVTGAGGSIGSALLERLPDAIGIDIDDWDIRMPYDFWIDRKEYVDPDLVFHLAAAKDAPEGEVDPEKVMRINALGTANVLRRWPRARVILASTCKACEPETAYGSSKLIAERLVLNAGGSVARFHNVVQTRGNVFETWSKTEGPLPVTECWRYFIDLEDAIDLLMKVPSLPPGRYMTFPGPAKRMADVAKHLYPDRPRHLIPRRRGDRVREPLHAEHEVISTTKFKGILRLDSPHD